MNCPPLYKAELLWQERGREPKWNEIETVKWEAKSLSQLDGGLPLRSALWELANQGGQANTIADIKTDR